MELRANEALSNFLTKLRYVDSHIACRHPPQSKQPTFQQILRSLGASHELFQIGCGELDEGLKKIALLAPLSGDVP
ncbi:MAG TPA: hypothetical protein VIR79_01770 [Nitrospira sp.]